MFVTWYPDSAITSGVNAWEAFHRADIIVAAGVILGLAVSIANLVLAAIRTGELAIQILAACAAVVLGFATIAVFVIVVESDGVDISIGMVLTQLCVAGAWLTAATTTVTVFALTQARR
jgi:hypothetical protein